MKVRCILKDPNFNLTYNKEYEVLGEEDKYFYLRNDNGIKSNYYKLWFEIIDEKEKEKDVMENKIEYKTLSLYKNKSETLLNNSIEVLIDGIIEGGRVVRELIDSKKIAPEKDLLDLLAVIREFDLCNNIQKQLNEVLDSGKYEVNFFK
ncbi:hypothetical protein [Clostridium perfringens]|uniref:hypothetical protein n=1 Tax=Clostridium perfringens TaxID=1502 RepID=UPI00096A8A8B|nr:hypothetical protein [Clostridium perfringens]